MPCLHGSLGLPSPLEYGISSFSSSRQSVSHNCKQKKQATECYADVYADSDITPRILNQLYPQS